MSIAKFGSALVAVEKSRYCISMWECVTTKLSNNNNKDKDKDKEEEDSLLEEVTIKLPETLYSTAYAISILRNFSDFESYIVDLIERDIEMIKEQYHNCNHRNRNSSNSIDALCSWSRG
jgi:hypothetical protein